MLPRPSNLLIPLRVDAIAGDVLYEREVKVLYTVKNGKGSGKGN
jgi:hypothetical protein